MSTLPMAAIVRLAIEPSWLSLSRAERGTHADNAQAICARHPQVQLEWYDADALGSGYTDFVICRFSSLEAYHFLWEELRDTKLFSTPWMRIVDVTFGIERGYEAYEQRPEDARA